MLVSRSKLSLLFGCLVLAALAVIVPVILPALFPPTMSRAAMISAVVVAEVIVVMAILAVWFTLRTLRSRAR